jgi:adenylate cyclase
MKNRLFLIILILIFITVNIYLFVNAPVPLSEKKTSGKMYPVAEAFRILAKENDAVRALYTKCIVGAGKKQKMKFDEKWEQKDVEAGPLPALFLRSTSAYLSKTRSSLGLFLGSDYPISSANRFKGRQVEYYNQMKLDKQPKFFLDETTGKYTAMFPDYASAETCVSCHNEHKDSPKKDWKINDMMGATTWTYPDDSLSLDQINQLLAFYRKGVAETYNVYLSKTAGFSKEPKPVVGTNWPSQGYFLPSLEVFLDSANRINAPGTLKSILALNGPRK